MHILTEPLRIGFTKVEHMVSFEEELELAMINRNMDS
jgi:hypothetical protein